MLKSYEHPEGTNLDLLLSLALHLEVFVQPVAVSICPTQLTLLLTPAANNIID